MGKIRFSILIIHSPAFECLTAFQQGVRIVIFLSFTYLSSEPSYEEGKSYFSYFTDEETKLRKTASTFIRHKTVAQGCPELVWYVHLHTGLPCIM